MSKFRFRLEVIRQLRQRALDTQRRVVADRDRELDAIAERNNGLMRLIAEADQGKRTVLFGQAEAAKSKVESPQSDMRTGPSDLRPLTFDPRPQMDIELLRRHQLYRGWLDQNVVETAAQVHRHEELLDRERAKLAEVSRRLKVVEKLRERQWQRHQKQCQRAEQTALDETALQGYLRRQDCTKDR